MGSKSTPQMIYHMPFITLLTRLILSKDFILREEKLLYVEKNSEEEKGIYHCIVYPSFKGFRKASCYN
jgi:hypothetical protein